MKTLIHALKPYRKAIVSGLVAGVFAAIPLVADGSISAADVSIIFGAIVSGSGLTFAIRNGDKPKAETS